MNKKTRLKNWEMLDMVDQFILGEELQETMPIRKEDLQREEFRMFILEVLNLRKMKENSDANAAEIAGYDWITKEGLNKDI